MVSQGRPTHTFCKDLPSSHTHCGLFVRLYKHLSAGSVSLLLLAVLYYCSHLLGAMTFEAYSSHHSGLFDLSPSGFRVTASVSAMVYSPSAGVNPASSICLYLYSFLGFRPRSGFFFAPGIVLFDLVFLI